MAIIETWLKTDLQQVVKVQELDGNMFAADNGANRIGVIVTNYGEPVTLTGGITGYFIRPDEATVIIDGQISGNRSWIDLPASAYVKTGPFSVVIKNGTTTIGACSGYIRRSTTDEIVDPGHVIPSLEELLAEIANMREATAAANTATAVANTAAGSANTAAGAATTAAGSANSAASAANTAASNANTKAAAANEAATNANAKASAANTAAGAANTAASNADQKASAANTAAGAANEAAANANDKASAANTAAGAANTAASAATTAAGTANAAATKIDDMTVAVTQGDPSSAPSATLELVNGHYRLTFTNVKGLKGDTGDAFHVVKTYASVAAMEADYSGTDVKIGEYVMVVNTVEDPDNAKVYIKGSSAWQFIVDMSGATGIKGDTGNGISGVSFSDYMLTLTFTDGTTYTTPSIRGATGPTGNGIASIVHNQDYTLTINMTDGNSYTTGSIRGEKGATGNTGATGPTGNGISSVVHNADDTLTIYFTDGTDYTTGSIRGEKGDPGAGVPVGGARGQILTKATDADFDVTWASAPDPTGKADKVEDATAGNFAGLDATGNLTDSGSKASDFLTQHQDISGKADKVSSATNGNFAGLDSNGNLTDSGHKHSDYLTSHQDISGKADKVESATSGDFAGLDANGNLTDSGKTSASFVASNQGSQNAGKALGIANDGSVTPVPFSGEDFTGATASTAGTHGYVPAPSAGYQEFFLKGDGTWADPPGGKLYVVDLDTVTNTSGSYTHTTSISGVTADMKPVKIELSNPAAFLSTVNVTTADGSITLTCSSVEGTSTVKVSLMFIATSDSLTSSEFDVLAGRIGTLSSLTTSAKTDTVAAINEVNANVGTLSSLHTTDKTSLVAATNEVSDQMATHGVFNTGTTWYAKSIDNNNIYQLQTKPNEIAALLFASGSWSRYWTLYPNEMGNTVSADLNTVETGRLQIFLVDQNTLNSWYKQKSSWGSAGFVLSYANSSNYAVQFGIVSGGIVLCVRAKVNGTWTTWKQINNDGDLA